MMPPDQLEKFKAMLAPAQEWGRWKKLGVSVCIRVICMIAAVTVKIAQAGNK